ncbi:MAG TPA: alpha/beta fold hydrolase [Candidatus Acidoferrales bacterium]|nr:alpha/beta fold hydrolase [Candidatus Acidoferrales bacterium]
MTTAIIIHGWSAEPTSDWFPWLRKELEQLGIKCIIPKMPNTDAPEISEWVAELSSVMQGVGGDIIFVGHSIGCQTIIRYLERTEGTLKADAIFVAGWINQLMLVEDQDAKIARPWLTLPIDWKMVRPHISKSVAIFSEDDPYVPLTEAEVFKRELDSKIIVEKDKGHYSLDTGVDSVPAVLDEILLMLK